MYTTLDGTHWIARDADRSLPPGQQPEEALERLLAAIAGAGVAVRWIAGGANEFWSTCSDLEPLFEAIGVLRRDTGYMRVYELASGRVGVIVDHAYEESDTFLFDSYADYLADVGFTPEYQ